MNPFVRDKKDYHRDLDIMGACLKDYALYLQIQTGRPYAECEAFVRKSLSTGGEFAVKDHAIKFLEREVCDREIKRGGFLGYLQYVVEKSCVLAPTMTVYYPASKIRSLLAEYIVKNVKMRNIFKKAMFVAKLRMQQLLYLFNKNAQQSAKIKNNSLSGAQASSGTILMNMTAHSSLTSACRVSAGYGNANNEKFLAGNRHYWSPVITKTNLLAIINKTDYASFAKAMAEFDIAIPTVDETMACIRYSTDLYWRDGAAMSEIRTFVNRMEPIQRAMVVYVGDMYHLAKHNDALVRGFIGELIEPAVAPIDNAGEIAKTMDGDIITLASYLCSDLLSGKLLSDLQTINPESYGIVIATCVKITETLARYEPMIRGLWATDSMPNSVALLPAIERRVVLVSDTDSTIFTNQFWTKWFVGKDDWSETSNRVAYVTTYITSQVVMHLLALLSTHMGVEKEEIHRISMKNEYFFPTFVTTSQAKCYFATKSAQEGNVFKEMDLEIKGKILRDSTLAPYITVMVEEFTRQIQETIMRDGVIGMRELINPVYDTEMEIINNVKQGKYCDFPTTKINEAASYANAFSSNWRYHDMWEKVFAPKYGYSEPLPYRVSKACAYTENATLCQDWIAKIEDRQLAERLKQWMADNNVRTISMFLMPLSVLKVTGVPKEIVDAVDIRKIVYTTCSPLYVILEAMGIFVVDDGYNKLISDMFNRFE